MGLLEWSDGIVYVDEPVQHLYFTEEAETREGSVTWKSYRPGIKAYLYYICIEQIVQPVLAIEWR